MLATATNAMLVVITDTMTTEGVFSYVQVVAAASAYASFCIDTVTG